VQPGRRYAIRIPTAHPILEQPRVQRFAEILRQPFDDAQGARLGELMDASHRSYSACGLGSPGTDRLVELVKERGLYGARITGGGSGGTVAIAGRADALPAVQEIARQYREETGRGGGVFAGSSPGAAAFGVLRIRR
jgi:L-arabinokinase